MSKSNNSFREKKQVQVKKIPSEINNSKMEIIFKSTTIKWVSILQLIFPVELILFQLYDETIFVHIRGYSFSLLSCDSQHFQYYSDKTVLLDKCSIDILY